MVQIADMYARLRSLDDPSVDHALAAALPTADSWSARMITLSLLERGRIDGLRVLVEQFHRLPPDAQAMVTGRCSDLDRPLRQAASKTGTRGPANVIRIVGRARALRLAYLVAVQLRHGSDQLRQEAAQCLLELARSVATDPNLKLPLCDPLAATMLQTTIEDAVRRYDQHCQPTVLRALLALAPRGLPKSMKSLSDLRCPALPDMRRLVENPDTALFRPALLMLLPIPTLTNSVLMGLSRLDAAQIGDVLAAPHLLLIPSVKQTLQKASSCACMLPDPDRLKSMPVHQLRALPRWIESLPLPPRLKVQHWAALNCADDGPTKLAALRELIRFPLPSPGTGDAITDDLTPIIARFCDDPDPAIARIALHEIIRRNSPGLPKVLLRLVNSTHGDVRAIASRALAPVGFERLWNAWPQMTYGKRLAAGRALIKLNPHFNVPLGQKLASPDQMSQLRAIGMIDTLNKAGLFEEQLLTLATHRDRGIASAAVGALGSADSPQVHNTLEGALKHSDSRVRANAVEALEQLQATRHAHRLVEMAREDESRPRANAIKALMQMRTQDAVGALNQMLDDDRPSHRRSALWLVENVGVIDVARHVTELSMGDPDQQVRSKATQVAQTLIQMLGTVPQTNDVT